MAQGSAPTKVSTRKSGAKKSGQKYQNKEAYRHNRNSRRTKEILAMPVDGLCRRCTDMVLWRKQFRKYKPLTAPKKWKVKKAYHILCDDCAHARQVCAKCTQKDEIVEVENPHDTSKQAEAERRELEAKLAGMRERQRRTYLRKLERGEIQVQDIPDISKDDGDEDSFSDFSDSELENEDNDE
ncbi:hypothetical protein EV182_000914 [Spiromyces aspiralis]|uniref:Uncharacterized protein n=1 Tax=Spiromyces aspiralis TaxID=68401 RepID=A0ACC1HMQ8_9FUNG|nr:hypothetical protein EV182_000914 [Spiromyces aspiralis]